MDEFFKTTLHSNNLYYYVVSCIEAKNAGVENYGDNNDINASNEKLYDEEAIIWRSSKVHAAQSPPALTLINDLVFSQPFISESLDESHMQILTPSTCVLMETSRTNIVKDTIGLTNKINDVL